MQHVINIRTNPSNQTDTDVCCLCLDPCLNHTQILACCKAAIHKKCMLHIILKGFTTCALCRTQFNPINMFDRRAALNSFYLLDTQTKLLLKHEFDHYLTFVTYTRTTIPRVSVRILIVLIVLIVIISWITLFHMESLTT